ncbi:MAG: hypothetical protein KF713_13785 [Turneriella sp.]|nr:hypothetical protein [Turneriella sp.]
MGATQSCSACCGLFNLKGSDDERRDWIRRNTEEFLSLDISLAANIVNFRKEREAATLPHRVREDIYVCPFVGFVDSQRTVRREDALPGSDEPDASMRTARHADAVPGSGVPDASVRTARHADAVPGSGVPDASMRTGCLLHPQGSPHPQIGLWAHPQNFSFYGEGICLSYDCLAKERRVYRADFFLWAEKVSVFDYARLASDHTLHRALAALPDLPRDLSRFYSLLADLYRQRGVVTTSFEDVEKSLPETFAALCGFLARRIDASHAEKLAEKLAAAMG